MHTNKNYRPLSVSSKRKMLMESLEKFFTEVDKHDEHMRLFLELVEKGAKISLRIIDWFVTNYSRVRGVVIVHTKKGEPNSSSAYFDVHDSYKQQLKQHSKKQFDPFCRRKRINFHYQVTVDGQTHIKKIKTTVGQLNFFKWAIENGVIKYIQDNFGDIEEVMRSYVKGQREAKRKLKDDKLKSEDTGGETTKNHSACGNSTHEEPKTRRRSSSFGTVSGTTSTSSVGTCSNTQHGAGSGGGGLV